MMIQRDDIIGIVLAGGKSCRMGKDKGLLRIGNCELALHAARKLEQVCQRVIISANDKAYLELGYEVISDLVADKGPMIGIYSVMQQAPAPLYLVLAADIPLIPLSVLQAMLPLANPGTIVVAKGPNGYPEPLIGYYPYCVFSQLEDCIQHQQFSLQHLFQTLPTCIFDVQKNAVDLEKEIFINLNQPADLSLIMEHHMELFNRSVHG